MNDLYGLIGKKLGHSFSPQIHNVIFKKLNISGLYNLYEVNEENLKQKIDELKVLDVKGLNVTIPYKVNVMQYLDVISTPARKIGAVNTIEFNNGVLTGYNTDYNGFGATLKNFKVNIENKRALILGTGGASKAVSTYLIDNGIMDVIYVSRNIEKISENLMGLRIISYDDASKINNGDIIINCTPCGMYPNVNACPINKKLLYNFSTAVDLIYNPEKTIFLKQAEEIGLQTISGLYMLVAQAVASQEIWQNISINNEIVSKVFEIIKKTPI